ncbi:MAG: hypothetical protein P8L66_01205 [Rhodospirillaceae bacterium]|nr:hypothetical protein [Rhodospirillaceae bacterium]
MYKVKSILKPGASAACVGLFTPRRDWTSSHKATFILACLAWYGDALAQENLPEQQLDTSIVADNLEDTYARCLTAARQDPEIGMEMALRWDRLTGGEPAKHCQAVAILELGDVEEAAQRLEELADHPTALAPVRAGLYAQAAQAWMDRADYARALVNLNKSAELRPNDAGLFFDRALIHAALKDLWAAVDDLNRVLDLEPLAIEALILRGSAYRKLEIADLALDDIERALKTDPNNIDALLEKGLLARDRAEKTEARLAWIRILEIAPDSSTADIVRRHMEEMDVSSDS